MEIEEINSLLQCCLDKVADRPRLPVLMAGETQAQAEEQMYFQASLLDQICQAIVATDREGNITFWNRYAETLYQWQAAEVIGKNIYAVTMPQMNQPQVKEMVGAVVKEGYWRGEFLVQRQDGSKFWAEVTNSPIKDAKGKITGFVVVAVDASDRHQFIEVLQQKEKTSENLYNARPDVIFRIREDGTLLDFKVRKDFYIEVPKSDFVGKKISDILPAKVWPEAMRSIKAAVSTEEIQILEYQLLKAERWYIFEAEIIKSKKDEVLAIIRDKSEQKEAEKKQAENKERYRIVSELISDFAYAAKIDLNGKLTTDWITDAFNRITGFSCEEIEARGGWQTLVHPHDRPMFIERLQTLLCWQSDVSEYRIVTKEGEIRWLRDYRQPVYCEDKERVLVIYGAAQDISERKQAEEALRQQTERERLIGRIHERIRQSWKVDEILEQAVTEIRNFLQVERVTIYRINSKVNGKFIVESVAEGCSSVLGVTCKNNTFKTRYANRYEEGEVSAVDDIYAENFTAKELALLNKLEIRANAIVPIIFNEKLWGLLCAHQCSAPRQWQPLEIDLLKQLATKMAIAIEQSELYQNKQRLNAELEARVKEVQKLNAELEAQVQERTAELQKALELEASLKRITNNVRDSLDENQILQTAVEELAIRLGMDSCNASLYDLEKGIGIICYEHVIKGPPYKGRIALMGNFPELYEPLLHKQYFQFCSIPINPERGRVAMLASPIVDDQGVLGDLWLVNSHNYGFSELEIRLVQQVANQCAIAIRQARLYQAAQTQVEQLAKLNNLKDDFLSTVSHELRTPMANMKMAIQMLKVAPPGDRQKRYLQILQSECNRETELINDLLDLQRLEAASYPLCLAEAINLQEWLPNVIEAFGSRLQERRQTLETDITPDLPPLVTDRAGLERIIAELLNNACKYTASEGAIVLKVSYQKEFSPQYENNHEEGYQPSKNTNSPSLDVIAFTVSNQAEIPTEELPNVFKKFYRVPKADLWKQGGTGLGLALVQKLVEQMHGVIRVESKKGWTTFRVELPTHTNWSFEKDKD